MTISVFRWLYTEATREVPISVWIAISQEYIHTVPKEYHIYEEEYRVRSDLVLFNFFFYMDYFLLLVCFS